MSFRKWYRRHRVLWVSLLASLCFIGLAIYGWGMTWENLFDALGGLLALLLLLVVGAAVLGWLIYKIRQLFD